MNIKKILGVIPARYASTRLPGKVLADLCGKPMIRHVYERAANTSCADADSSVIPQRLPRRCGGCGKGKHKDGTWR